MVVGTRAVGLIVTVVALSCEWCACAPKRPRVTYRAVQEMMERDELFGDVLKERVILPDGTEGVPAWAKDVLPQDAAETGVDPLAELHRLVTPTQYRSGRDMTLAAAVLGTAIRCVTYKRAAVHVALAARLLALCNEDQKVMNRVAVLAHALPRTLDVLMSLGVPHTELLELFNRTAPHATAEKFARDKLTSDLDECATALKAAVASTCKVADMREYVRDMGLSAVPPTTDAAATPPPEQTENQAGPEITDDQRVADAVPLDAIVHMLRSNENAMLDTYDRMYMLRSADMDVWKMVLKYPELPSDPEEFTRTPPTHIRDVVVKMMDRKAKTAMVKEQAAEREKAAARASTTALHYDERTIPLMMN